MWPETPLAKQFHHGGAKNARNPAAVETRS
jgi:hypothetical protein